MLTGFMLSAVTAGSIGAMISILSGHPPLVILLFYSLAGVCGVLAFLCRTMAAPRSLD